MDIGLILWVHAIPGFALGLASWLVFWPALWAKLDEYVRKITPNGRLDSPIVALFFLSLPTVIVGLTLFLTGLYFLHLTLQFVLGILGLVFLSWFTYRFSDRAIRVEIDTF